MSKYAIDTSIWLDYFAGNNPNVRPLIERNQLVTSVIAIAELADKFFREDQSFDRALRFIQSKAKIVPLTASLALTAAMLKRNQRKIHPKFGLADAIHVATAHEEKAIFVTKDNDCRGINHVQILK